MPRMMDASFSVTLSAATARAAVTLVSPFGLSGPDEVRSFMVTYRELASLMGSGCPRLSASLKRLQLGQNSIFFKSCPPRRAMSVPGTAFHHFNELAALWDLPLFKSLMCMDQRRSQR